MRRKATAHSSTARGKQAGSPESAELRIRLLGPFEVRVRGRAGARPIEFSNAKTQALLAILASERGRVFPQEQLVELLWPCGEAGGRTPEQERRDRANLRGRVAELRRLHPALARSLTTRSAAEPGAGGYGLERSPCIWVDVEALAHRCARGRALARREKFSKAVTHLEEAAEFYRGDFLEEERYADWAAELRNLWRERHLECLTRLADGYARLGKYRQAVERYRQILALRPYHEEAWRALLRTLYHSGQPAEALEAYQECSETLKTLDVAPSPETQALAERIRRQTLQETAPPPPPPPEPALPYSLGKTPLVGRERELAILRACWEAARAGRGRGVLLWGEAGLGKSRLLEAFLAEVRASPARGLSAQGSCTPDPRPYGGLISLIRSLGQDTKGKAALRRAVRELEPIWQTELLALLPELESLAVPTPVPQASSLPAEEVRRRRRGALFRLLVKPAERHPLLLALDDLHRADPETRQFLRDFLPRLSAYPVLFLGACRSEEGAMETLREIPNVEAVRLAPLTPKNVEALLEGLSSASGLPRELSVCLHRATGGVPLFLVSLLRHLFEEGAFRVDPQGRWQIDPGRLEEPIVAGTLPADVREVLQRRLKRLAPPERLLLETAAVLGHPVPAELLRPAWERISAGSDAARFEEILHLLHGAHLLHRSGDAYLFSHELLREAVYDDLPAERKRELHRVAAEALEALCGDELASQRSRLARHFARAGQPEKALGHLLPALDEAVERYHWEEGQELVELGLQQLAAVGAGEARPSSTPDLDEKRFALLIRRAQIAMYQGRIQEAERDLEALEGLAERRGDEARLADVFLHRSRLLRDQGRYEPAQEAARRALEGARRARDRAQEAEALALLGHSLQNAGDARVALAAYEPALELYRRLGDRRGEADTLESLGQAHRALGDYEQALERTEQAIQIYREIEDPAGEGNALLGLGAVYFYRGQTGRALELAEESLRCAERCGYRTLEVTVLQNLGQAYKVSGHYERALEYERRAVEVCREIGNRDTGSWALAGLGQIHAALGRYDEALEYLREALETAETIGNRRVAWGARYHLGLVHRHRGEVERALAELEGVRREAHEAGEARMEASALHQLGKTSGFLGRTDEALSRMDEALRLIRKLKSTDMELNLLSDRAMVHLRAGDLERALEDAERAVELLERQGGGDQAAWVLFHYSEVLRALGRDDEARAPLRRAFQILRERALKIHDGKLRRSFLENVAANRAVVEAYRAHIDPRGSLAAVLMSEAECYELLREVRWAQGVYCPHCKGSEIRPHGWVSGRPERRYRCTSCRRTFTDRTGTVLAHRNLPLGKLLQALRLVSEIESPLKPGELAELLEVDPKTASDLLRKLSAALREEPWMRELARRLG